MFRRDYYLDRIRLDYHTKAIKYITGVRMAGKTYLLKSIQEELLESGIMADHIINYDIDSINYSHIVYVSDLAIDIDRRIKDNKKYYIFIDEAQYIRFIDGDSISAINESFNISLFITSSEKRYWCSNSSFIKYEIFPFSFYEMKQYYEYNEWEWNDELFYEYVRYGGFPLRFEYKADIYIFKRFKSLFEKIVEKDITRINRRKVNPEKFIRTVESLCNNNMKSLADICDACNSTKTMTLYGWAYNPNSTCNEKMTVAYSTVKKYIDLMEEVYLIHRIECYKSRKLYSIMTTDVGFRFETKFNPNNYDVKYILDNRIDNGIRPTREYTGKEILKEDISYTCSSREEIERMVNYEKECRNGLEPSYNVFIAYDYNSALGNINNIIYNELVSRGYSVYIEETKKCDSIIYYVTKNEERCYLTVEPYGWCVSDLEYIEMSRTIGGEKLNIIGFDESCEDNEDFVYLNIIDFLLHRRNIIFHRVHVSNYDLKIHII